jgi:cytochrome d ubiquinol oxidase subunit II
LSSWINPTSILGGVLAVTVCAYLAAVYMIWDAQRFAGADMIEYFRRRAVGAAVAAGIVAFAGFFVLHDYAHYVFDGLTSRALPLVIISAACGLGSLVLLMRDEHRGARVLAAGAAATVVGARGVAQWPSLPATTVHAAQAARPRPDLTTILVVWRRGRHPALARIPLRLDQKSMLTSTPDNRTETGEASDANPDPSVSAEPWPHRRAGLRWISPSSSPPSLT